jgi:hypothetical protein
MTSSILLERKALARCFARKIDLDLIGEGFESENPELG